MSEKKNVAFYILSVLKKHSSSKKRLTQSRIAEYLKRDFGRECDLRTVKSGLDSLLDLGYDLKYETLHGREYRTGWYIDRLFSETETENILLALHSATHLSGEELSAIKEKLSPMLSGAENFDKVSPPHRERSAASVTDILKVINRAIEKCRMISFPIISHRIGGKPSFERDMMGQVREYLIKPIGIVCISGRAHLYGEIGDTGKRRYFALDRIHEPTLTDISFVPSGENAVLPQNRLERKKPIGEVRERAVILCDDSILPDIYDALGSACSILSAYNGKTELQVIAASEQLIPFILRFGSRIEALAPIKLRRAVSIELHNASDKYRFQTKLRGHIS